MPLFIIFESVGVFEGASSLWVSLMKTKRNRELKITHAVLERRTLNFSSSKNRKLVKLWWVWARERKKRAFLVPFILSNRKFLHLCFISMYSVLNTLSDYKYFYISKKTLLHTPVLLVFKIVESLSVYP